MTATVLITAAWAIVTTALLELSSLGFHPVAVLLASVTTVAMLTWPAAQIIASESDCYWFQRRIPGVFIGTASLLPIIIAALSSDFPQFACRTGRNHMCSHFGIFVVGHLIGSTIIITATMMLFGTIAYYTRNPSKSVRGKIGQWGSALDRWQ